MAANIALARRGVHPASRRGVPALPRAPCAPPGSARKRAGGSPTQRLSTHPSAIRPWMRGETTPTRRSTPRHGQRERGRSGTQSARTFADWASESASSGATRDSPRRPGRGARPVRRLRELDRARRTEPAVHHRARDRPRAGRAPARSSRRTEVSRPGAVQRPAQRPARARRSGRPQPGQRRTAFRAAPPRPSPGGGRPALEAGHAVLERRDARGQGGRETPRSGSDRRSSPGSLASSPGERATCAGQVDDPARERRAVRALAR